MAAYPGQTRTRTTLGQLCAAWNQTRVCSDAWSTEMQCLRPLRHFGAPSPFESLIMLKHHNVPSDEWRILPAPSSPLTPLLLFLCALPLTSLSLSLSPLHFSPLLSSPPLSLSDWLQSLGLHCSPLLDLNHMLQGWYHTHWVSDIQSELHAHTRYRSTYSIPVFTMNPSSYSSSHQPPVYQRYSQLHVILSWMID